MTDREAQLEEEVAQYRAELLTLRRENELLRAKVDLLVRRVFGSSSERLSPDQLSLAIALPEAPKAPEPVQKPQPVQKRSNNTASTPRLPENLPVVEEVIEPEEVKTEPQSWRRIGEEVSEQPDYEPGHFLRRRTIRPTCVHRTDPDLAPVTAPLPPKLQDRCIATAALISHVVVNKICCHIPLYRQETLFKTQYHVHLPRQTLDRWLQLVPAPNPKPPPDRRTPAKNQGRTQTSTSHSRQ